MNDEGQSYHSGEITKVLGALCQEPETKTKYTSSYTTTIHSSKHLLIQQTLSGVEGDRRWVQRQRRHGLPCHGSCDRKRVVEYRMVTANQAETTSPV